MGKAKPRSSEKNKKAAVVSFAHRMSRPECDDIDTRARHVIQTVLDQNIMVEAAAGTGKTTSIVDRMLNLIDTGHAEFDRMAAITFTRKAAAELRERFTMALHQRIADYNQAQSSGATDDQLRLQRLRQVLSAPQSLFIGTIHSFCARLIRERPIEFRVQPDFHELNAEEDQQLQLQAWQANIDELIAMRHPLIDQIEELGLTRRQLWDCFENFIKYRDVDDWPNHFEPDFDPTPIRQAMAATLERIRQLIPLFPRDRRSDTLMNKMEMIARMSQRSFARESRFFQLLDQFDCSVSVVKSAWHSEDVARAEQELWNNFREQFVRPGMDYWHQRRYAHVVDFVRRALQIYERLKQSSGSLDFTDLLMVAARGLREQAHLRSYFRQRFTHLLVDEFQDTDPIQAEAIVWLASQEEEEEEEEEEEVVEDQPHWQSCRLRPGALFIVGDPKQSIYRFRRGDIVTYNRMRDIFTSTGGQIVSLLKNFRSTSELIQWNNEFFATRFPAQPSQVAPAFAEMFAARIDQPIGQLHGVRKLTLPPQNIGQVTQLEASRIAEFIRRAIDQQLTISTFDVQQRCILRPVQASDFLLLVRTKRNLQQFKTALEREGLAVDASGNNALAELEPLHVLLQCLRAIDDATNPVAYLSLMRSRLFGFSDQELFDWQKAGGAFNYRALIPAGLSPSLSNRFEHVHQKLQQCQLWLRELPPATAVELIAIDLGLMARATQEEAGNIALGSLYKALECLRFESTQFDSAADMISALERLIDSDEVESCPAMTSDRGAVRIMNLHKAKGLEAPIVFLADTSSGMNNAPNCHIVRTPGRQTGYMSIEEKTKFRTQRIAMPAGWPAFQDEEAGFIAAEEDRLLYVATTRAANMLIVSVGKPNSRWAPLHEYLETVPELAIPESSSGQRSADDTSDLASNLAVMNQLKSDLERIDQQWSQVLRSSYTLQTAKAQGLAGRSRPRHQTNGEYGINWGTAVHQLLELCHKTAVTDWQTHAAAIAEEHDIEHDLVPEMIETVQSVIDSSIWRRANTALRSFSELPFEAYQPAYSGGPHLPVVLRGVIDLIFEEATGWVIVDYKTDGVSESELPRLVDYYRGQLLAYAKTWQNLTGMPVAETGLFVTKLKRYVQVT